MIIRRGKNESGGSRYGSVRSWRASWAMDAVDMERNVSGKRGGIVAKGTWKNPFKISRDRNMEQWYFYRGLMDSSTMLIKLLQGFE